MKRNGKDFIKVLLIVIMSSGLNYFMICYFNSKIIQIGVILGVSILTAFLLLVLQKNNSIKEIIGHISNISNLDFSIPESVDIQRM